MTALAHMTDEEKLVWANSTNDQVNAERKRAGLPPIRWTIRNGHLAIEAAPLTNRAADVWRERADLA